MSATTGRTSTTYFPTVKSFTLSAIRPGNESSSIQLVLPSERSATASGTSARPTSPTAPAGAHTRLRSIRLARMIASGMNRKTAK